MHELTEEDRDAIMRVAKALCRDERFQNLVIESISRALTDEEIIETLFDNGSSGGYTYTP
ncbi:hypothetical protein [Mesorhizobium sp. ANAO-SY3R2]|uniref:hypothetical protein n=1 Tax=Mesorhizobium sp. ANAO-SY3R2 TaxID=3166644 RepID=UPI00366E4A9A